MAIVLIYETNENDELYLQHLVALSNSIKDDDMIDSGVVTVDENGPDGLLDRGDHFLDCNYRRFQAINNECPMDNLLESVQEQGLSRPPVNQN